MSSSNMEAKGFFSSLFDFGITSFITLKFLRVIYTVLVVLILLGGVVFLIAGLSQGGATAVFSVLLVPLVTLLYLILARVYMEVIAIFFRIGENTTLMAQALGGGAPGGQMSGPYGSGPQGPPPSYGSGPQGPPPSYGSGPQGPTSGDPMR